VPVEVRPYSGSARDYIASVSTAFGEQLVEEDIPVFEKTDEADRRLAAYDGERVVGNAGVVAFSLTVPGGELPCAGVTAVGVHPTHRRRGILRQLMRLQLDDVHERGEPLAALWASEGVIYQRFGYGLATTRGHFKLPRSGSALRRVPEPRGSTRIVEKDEARRVLPAIFDRYRPTHPGCFSRSPELWEAEVFYDPERWRRGAGPAFYVVHETDGEPDGFARYRIRADWGDAGPNSSLLVTEVVGTTDSAQLELWQYLFGVDLIATIEAWNVPADDPLILQLVEPRRLGFGISDALWLRIVDVAGALNGRRYAADGRVVLELTDEFCAWNAGRWALEVEGGVGRAERTDAEAELALETNDLAAAYLGAFGIGRLLRAGRGVELQGGAGERLDPMLRTDRAPWSPIVF
jgi:predicted acetyltransferase